MPPFFEHALRLTWFAVLGYWLWAALWAKRIERQESFVKRLFAYWLPLFIALQLLGPGEWFGHSVLREQFVPHTTLVYSVGLSLAISGALLAISSRFMLGRNWSATVQLKQDHELITRGPYRFVRHPIYLGYLVTHVAFFFAHPTLWNAAVIIIGDGTLIARALMEERVLQRDATYAAYCQRVSWHLMPGVF